MGTGAAVGGGWGSQSSGTVTVNGNTLADLAAAINGSTIGGGNNITALATTAGLQMTSSTGGAANGDAITATSHLVDQSTGVSSSITMGSFANSTDTLAGTLNFTAANGAKSLTLDSTDNTLSSLVNKLNAAGSNYGVQASIAVNGSTGWDSLVLTTTANGGSITGTTGSSLTDTTTTANLSYSGSSAYNMGISSSTGGTAVLDSATSQTAATFASNTKAGTGTATISYSDGAGQSLSATDLSNQTDAEGALTALNTAITDVAAQDGYIGAQINTLNAVSQVLSTQQENVVSAQNAVQATDYASATSNMSKYEILSQTGISALAQANSMSQEVTKLLQ
jgi:flagellin